MEPRLKGLSSLALVLFLAGCATTAPDSAVVPPAPTIPQVVERQMRIAPFDHVLWGVLIEEEDGTLIYEKNPDVLMIPGSNRKLFTSALAVDCLGIDSTIPTDFWLDGSIEKGTLDGNLIVQGHGDPSLGGRYYEGDRDQPFAPLVGALRSRGIDRVSGGVIADVSDFDRETTPGSWKTDNLGAYYAAPVDALAFNENVVGIAVDASDCRKVSGTTDPAFVPLSIEVGCAEEGVQRFVVGEGNRAAVTGTVSDRPRRYSDVPAVTDPALYTAQAVADVLRRSGIRVDGSAGVMTERKSWKEHLVTIQSPPLFLLVSTVLKNSQNLYAEMLFKRVAIGEQPSSYEAARRIEYAFLQGLGIAPTEVYADDGSGLSVENMMTPRAVVKLLRWMNHPHRKGAFFQLLATPGQEGTLSRRLKGLEERMRGKTGTISGVSALSGYVVGSNGRLRYFSLYINHHLGDSDAREAVLDAIVQRIAEF